MFNELINGSNVEIFTYMTVLFTGVFFLSIILLVYLMRVRPQFFSSLASKHPFLAGMLVLTYLAMWTSFIILLTNGLWK